MLKFLYYLCFLLSVCALFIASLFLRSGYNFLIHKSGSIGAYTFSVYDEFSRVIEQVNVNIRYSSLDKIQGLEQVSQDKLLDAVGLVEGMEIDPARYNKLFQHLNSYPWIESYSVESSIFPKRIRITVKEAKPKFVVEYDGQSWLMSDKGVLLECLDTLKNPNLVLIASSLPRLYDDDPSGIRKDHTTLASTSQRIKTALTMLDYFDLIGGLPFNYSTVSIMPFGELQFEVNDDTPVKVIQLVAHEISEAKTKKAQLESILSDLNNRSETANVVDLRFSDQAIVK